MSLQAIVRRTVTVSATYTGVPSPAEREKLKAQGAEFKSGQWVRSRSVSDIVGENDVIAYFNA